MWTNFSIHCLYAQFQEMNYLEKDMQYRRMLGRADPEEKERCEQELKQLEAAMGDARAAHQLLERECYRLDQVDFDDFDNGKNYKERNE